MIRLGQHTFSVTDARKTLAMATTLLEQLADGRDASVLDEHRRRVAQALDGVDPARAPARELEQPLRLVWSALIDAGPALRAAGQLPARAEGSVVHLARSGGGVPKVGVGSVAVDVAGVEGDAQANRVHHGRPWQALCLWSTEVIEAFRRDGHPLAPGSAGENVTIEGLCWSDVRPGVRLALGGVVCEVSSYAVPCRKNARWFDGGAFDVMHHRRGPVSRVYATVVRAGRIDVGDRAVLEP